MPPAGPGLSRLRSPINPTPLRVEVHLRQLKALLPSITIGVMGNGVIYLIPLLVGGMVSDRGFDEQVAGYMASADLGGYALATFLTAMLLDRVPWRRMAYVALGILVAANIATTFTHDITAFALARIASGLGCGVLAALASVTIGQSADPDRNYGFLLAASLLYGTAALWGLPALLGRFGLDSAYWMLAGLGVLMCFVVPAIPAGRKSSAQTPESGGHMPHWLLAAAVLLSILLFWADQNDIYAYIERVGNASQINPEFIGFSLGIANLTGFVGASLVAALGARAGRLIPILIATVINLGCLYVLSRPATPWVYLAAISVTSLTWNIVNPFQLGILASVDPTGKALALAATVTGAGLAIGPAIGAAAIGFGGYPAIFWIAGALAVVSVLLMLPALRTPTDQGHAPQ
jgi:predicted MFS family arabinose efflux permease